MGLNGNYLYSCIKVNVEQDYLLLNELPSMISMNGKTFNVIYCTQSISGDIFLSNDNGPYITLGNAFAQIFFGRGETYECCLLTIHFITVAIFKLFDNHYKIFDSHSRDQHGIPSYFGTCVLLTVQGLENLVGFFQATYPGTCVPFEMKGVIINEVFTNNTENTSQLETNERLQTICHNETQCRSQVQKSVIYDNNQNNNTTKKLKKTDQEIREKRLQARRLNYLKRKQAESSLAKEERLKKCRRYQQQQRENESKHHQQSRLHTQQIYNVKKG